jgi:hypothetical protein
MKQIFAAIMLAMGVPQAKIDSLLAMTDEQAKEFKPDEIVKEIGETQRNKLLNDPEFLNAIPEDKVPETTRKKIESGQYARFQNELIEVAMKKLGLKDKEDLTDEDKKSIKGLTEKIARTYLEKNNGSDGLKKLQADLQAALEEKTTLETSLTEKLTNREKELNGEFGSKMVNMLTKLQLSNLDKVKLAVQPGYIATPVLEKLRSKYHLNLNGEEIELKQKDNPALDVIDKAGKKLSFGEALRAVVLEDKLGTEITEEEGGKAGGGRTKVKVDGGSGGGEGGEVEVASYISDKMQSVLDAEAAGEGGK